MKREVTNPQPGLNRIILGLALVAVLAFGWVMGYRHGERDAELADAYDFPTETELSTYTTSIYESSLCPAWTSSGRGELESFRVPCDDDRAWTFQPNTTSLYVSGTPDVYGQPWYRSVTLSHYDCVRDPFRSELTDCTYRSPSWALGAGAIRLWR